MKDLQPQIVSQIDHLLSNLEKKDHFDSHIGLTHSFAEDANVQRINPSRYFPQTYQMRRPSNNLSRFNSYLNFQHGKRTSLLPLTIKKCTICKAAGEPFIGHDTSQYPNITPHDKQKFVMSRCLDIESDELPSEYEEQMQIETPISQQVGLCTNSMNSASLSRVQVFKSSEVTLYYNDYPLQLTVDTGATASMISLPICKAANISVMPAVQKAIQADGHTELPVVGEIDMLVQYENVPPMCLNALVVPELAHGILAGMPFVITNNVVIDAPKSAIIVQDTHVINYGACVPNTSIVKASINLVLFPGDSLDVSYPPSFRMDDHLALELRIEFNDSCPSPAIVDVKSGSFSIVNDTAFPVKLKRGQVIAQVRSVSNDNIPHGSSSTGVPQHELSLSKSFKGNYLDAIVIDPQTKLSAEQHKHFSDIHNRFKSVFDPRFGTYNDKSGIIKATVDLCPTPPPLRKGHVPSYNSETLEILRRA